MRSRLARLAPAEHRGHAPVHRVEAGTLAEHVGQRHGGAADAAQFCASVWRQAQFEAGVDDLRPDCVVPTASAERRHRPLLVPVGEAERVDGNRRMVELRFAEISHQTRSNVCAKAGCRNRFATSRTMKRAVIGIPLKANALMRVLPSVGTLGVLLELNAHEIQSRKAPA
jgi:hypothetical protein